MDLTPQRNLNKERLSLASVWFIEWKLLSSLPLSGDNSEIVVNRTALEFSQTLQASESTKVSTGILLTTVTTVTVKISHDEGNLKFHYYNRKNVWITHVLRRIEPTPLASFFEICFINSLPFSPRSLRSFPFCNAHDENFMYLSCLSCILRVSSMTVLLCNDHDSLT